MDDKVDTLLALYKEQNAQARHQEDQRATMTNYVLALTGGLLGLMSTPGFRTAQGPLGCFLFVIGCFGAVVTAKHYERNRYHARIAGRYRRRIEEVQPEAAIDREGVREQQLEDFPYLYNERLWKLWVTLHAVIAGLGALLAVLAWTS